MFNNLATLTGQSFSVYDVLVVAQPVISSTGFGVQIIWAVAGDVVEAYFFDSGLLLAEVDFAYRAVLVCWPIGFVFGPPPA